MSTKKRRPRATLAASAGPNKQAWQRCGSTANTQTSVPATDLDYGKLTQLMGRCGNRIITEFFADIRRRPIDVVCADFARLDPEFLNLLEI